MRLDIIYKLDNNKMAGRNARITAYNMKVKLEIVTINMVNNRTSIGSV